MKLKDPKDFSTQELQQIVCMVGSKRELGTYLALTPKDLNQLWKERVLMTPAENARSLSLTALAGMVGRFSSIEGLASFLGVSRATLLGIFKGKSAGLMWKWDFYEKDVIERYLGKYGTVRLAARMMTVASGYEVNVTETKLREAAVKLQVNLGELLDWSSSNHSNAKGRRAELDFKTLQGELVEEDCNLTGGSQASYDFKMKNGERVNVKSSRAYRFTAKTRRKAPYYWKFSTAGAGLCDLFALMFYDEKMERLLYSKLVDPIEAFKRGLTLTVKGTDLGWTSVLPTQSLL